MLRNTHSRETQQSPTISMETILLENIFNIIYCVCMHACVHIVAHCGCQRTTCRNWFSPSTVCLPGVELRLSGLVASPFIC